MEYIEGQSLGDLVKKRGALREAEAVGYVKQVANALSYIHERSINHLDIKPSNIMLRQSDGKAILIDFGVAKQYDASTKEGTTTTPVGISHGYSPTEQYLRNGVSQFSPESDIYSLGATLYHLLSGTRPPESIELTSMNLAPLPPSTSASCQEAVNQAMKVDKSERPHSVTEFMKILEGKGKPSKGSQSEITVVESRKPAVPPRIATVPVTPAPKKSHTGLYVFIVIILMALAGGGAAWYFMNRNNSEEEEYFDDEYVNDNNADDDEDYHVCTDKDGDKFYWTGNVDENGNAYGEGTAVYEDESLGIYVGEYSNGGYYNAIQYDSNGNFLCKIVDGEVVYEE